MIWAGGAITAPRRVDRICSQTDIAATLLSQMEIDYSDFPFSKNIFNPNAPEFAFYTFNNGFGMITPTGKTVFDSNSNQVILSEGTGNEEALLQGKTILQVLYDVLAGK
jgi:membrane-anchored protein YejM (alkaline phosphatase superfamily)